MKNTFNIIAILVLAVVSTTSLVMHFVGQETERNYGALPTYQNFQMLQAGTGYNGVYVGNGISTSTPVASTTPTLAGITATSSIRMPNQAAGCAQFNSAGLLTSVGTNCASSAAGKEINYYAATSSINDTSATLVPATTTSIATGNSIMIWASCTMPNNNTTVTGYLDVGNPGGGTTTISVSAVGEAGNDNNRDPLAFNGLYTATTTGNIFIAINTTRFTGITTACTNYNFSYIRFTN